jgi:phospholipid transport system transporter-binding protein
MLVLPATLTQAQAGSCAQVLLASIAASTGAVKVDASPLGLFDSSALAVLLDCRRHALARNRAFHVHAMPERLAVLAGLYGVADLLTP